MKQVSKDEEKQAIDGFGLIKSNRSNTNKSKKGNRGGEDNLRSTEILINAQFMAEQEAKQNQKIDLQQKIKEINDRFNIG